MKPVSRCGVGGVLLVLAVCLTASGHAQDTRLHGGRGACGTTYFLPSSKGSLVLAVRLDDARYTLLNPRSGKVFRRTAKRLAAVGDVDLDGEPELFVWSYLGGETGNLVLETLDGSPVWNVDVRIPPVHKRKAYIPPVLIYDLDADGTAEIIVPREAGQAGVFQAGNGEAASDGALVDKAVEIMTTYPLLDNPHRLIPATMIKGDRTYLDFVGDTRPEWIPQAMDGRPVVPFAVKSFTGSPLWNFVPPPPRGITAAFPEAVFSADTADADGDGLNELYLGGYNRVFVLSVDGRLLNVLENVFF